MKKSNLNKILFCIIGIFTFISCASAAEYNVDISYGSVLHFIPGSQYEGVSCSYSGDKQYFEFSDTTYSEDHYVEMINPSVTSGSATAVCSYTKKRSHVGSNVPVVSNNGTDTFVFNIVQRKDLSKFKLVLHRQFSYMVDLKTYFTLNENTNIDKIVLTGQLLEIFENSNGEVACNTQSCVLNLAQNAPTGTFVGTIKYGEVAHELTVEVKDEWVVYANTGGYGSCKFDDGWELNGNNANYYEKTINTDGTKLPVCSADSSQNNSYLGLEFVGWTYNKKTQNFNYNNYQSVDVCATYYGTDNPDVGWVAGNSLFAPKELNYDYRGNSVFYACYKKTGIGFNLLGYKIIDDDNGIHKWDLVERDGAVSSRVHYKVYDNGVKEIVLPKKVENDGIVDNNEVFVGWINNRDYYNKIYAGGEKVSVEEGLIYTPYFMIQKTETERNITVYTKKKIVVDLPSDFICINKTTDNYSIVGSGNKCTITGISSTNGSYISESIVTNSKTFTLKIQIVEGAYNSGDEISDITIGNGDLIIDPGNDSGGKSSIKVPANCDSYLVGRKGENVVSPYYFDFTNDYGTYSGHIITYYARSNCMGDGNHALETEFAALCLDPGRAGPPRSDSALAKDGSNVGVTEYKFYRYINVNDEVESYREFSRAVAYIINQIGNVPLSTFNTNNYEDKIAANIALRIIATQYPDLSVKPSESASGDDGAGTVRYFSAYQAYQSMGNHLRGVIGNSQYRVKAGPSASGKNVDCSEQNRAQYMYCNSEWSWRENTESLQNRVAEFLSYAHGAAAMPDDWEITPSMRISDEFDGTRLVVNLVYPNALNKVNYEVYLNISEEMSKVYQIDMEKTALINNVKQFTCVSGSEKNGKCLRYKVIVPPDTAGGGQYVDLTAHPITVYFTVDTSNEVVFPDKNSRDIYFEVGYASTYTKESAFMVEPARGSNSIQRMILFNPEKILKIFPITLYDCDILIEQYGDQPDKYEQIYKAGCCETISDDSTEYQDFVNTYCKKNCVMNNYKPVCTSQDDVKDYKIYEATTVNGDTNYSCIVDARKPTELSVENQLLIMSGQYNGDRDYYSETSNMTDISGENSIAIDAYKTNPYCRVTCKEDWEFNMPGYGDFIGNNAVKAGSLFQINHSINLKSTVTCVTSYIDLGGYEDALEQLSNEINDAYEKYSFRAAAINDIYATSVDKGAWYTYDVEVKDCTTSEFNYGSNGRASSAAVGSCSVKGDYTMKCVSSTDYNNHFECRKGNSDVTNYCTSSDVENLNCGVTGQKTVSGQYVSCPQSQDGVDGCHCASSGQHSVTCMKPKKVDCNRNDVRNGVTGCGIDTTDTYITTTGTCESNYDSRTGTCAINTDGRYTSSCGLGDLTSSGFVDRTDQASRGCYIDGDYKKVTQDKHSGSGSTSDSDCLVWQVRTANTTKINSYKIDGSEDIDRSHSSINGKKDDGTSLTGYAETEYSEGTSKACVTDGDITCKLHIDTVINDYKCEVTASGDKSEATWKQHLIDDHVYYAGDTKLIKNNIEYYYRLLNEKQVTLTTVVNKFAQCQNFYVSNSNTTAPSKVYNGTSYYSSALNVLDTSDSSYSINTKFDPAGTFGYDESEYMNMMGNNRVIASQNGYTTSSKSGMYSSTNLNIGNFNSCYGKEGNYVNASGQSVDCNDVLNGVSHFETAGYDFNDNLLSKYTFVLCDLDNLNYTYDSKDQCTTSDYYYYNANYVKKSLTSSGDYDNKVTWYRYLVNDSIYPGFDFANVNSKKSAAGNVVTTYDPNDWSLMGTKNVFPISGTTRRNIYQYYYSFKGIGNYYNGDHSEDRNSIGRLMGYEDSIIKSNSRICFYEVYESACICCGRNELGPVTDASNVNSYQYVVYKESSFVDGSGHYGFTPSTVSLYNLDGFASNSHAANWQSNDHYFYNGNNGYTTNKGKELADYIEEKGENAYAETPEYSYILTPNAMANIRKMNDSANYGYGKDTVYQIENSTYLARSSSENGHLVTTDVADQIIFTHYGSNFVKNNLSVYETPEYKNQLLSNKGMSNDCYVTSGNISSLNDKKKNCKWVDYVQTVVPGNESQGYFRMAFK